MVLTLTKLRRTVVGNMRLAIYQVTFDNSYPTGGEALTAADLGLSSIEIMKTDGGDGGYVPQFDYANNKMLMFEAGADGAALDEVTATTDLSSVSFRIEVTGR